MFRGEQSRGGYHNARTFVRGIFLLLFGALFHLTGTSLAHAASAGCITVSGGAFNLSAPITGSDQINGGAGLTFAFEAGETLTFTTTGNPDVFSVTIGGTAFPNGLTAFVFRS